jgi:hypothetical protein
MTPEAPVPTFTLRDWRSGARPVAGAVGACGLMLLACSWFAFAPGRVGESNDVGSPPAVHIQQAHDASRIAPRRPVAPAPQRDVGRQRTVTHRQGPPHVLSTGTRSGKSATPPATPASPASAAAAATQPNPAAPAPPPQPVPAATLPAQLDGPPAVTVPVPQVSVPQLPSVTVPDLGTTTTPLGLP